MNKDDEDLTIENAFNDYLASAVETFSKLGLEGNEVDILSVILRCFENCMPAKNAVKRSRNGCFKTFLLKLIDFLLNVSKILGCLFQYSSCNKGNEEVLYK